MHVVYLRAHRRCEVSLVCHTKIANAMAIDRHVRNLPVIVFIMVLLCAYCSYRCEVRLDLVKHSFTVHSFEPNFYFVCGIKGCLHGFRFGATLSSFKSHASRKHPDWKKCINEVEIAPTSSSSEVPLRSVFHEPNYEDRPEVLLLNSMPDDTQVWKSPSPQQTAALFLLTLQEKYSLSQKAINFAVGSINTIVDNVCVSVQDSVLNTLDQNGSPSPADIKACFNYSDPFSSLQTEYQQSKFYREEFGLVEPVTVELGTSYQYRRSGAKRSLVEQSDTYQYIPLIKNLEWLLQNRDIYHEKHTSKEMGLLYDFCDGKLFRDHPLFTADCHALQIILYFDEVETANPLGSYRGYHKLGLFYYFLSNIEPRLRSYLRCIQLAACITVPNLEKYGFDMVLKKFIQDANKLSEGVTMTIGGEQKFVRGGVLLALADTLAAHAMGGFKIGVGFSLRKCRMCLATKDQISTKFKARDFVLRTPDSYDYHCSLLDGSLYKEHSTTYGVNSYSPLNELRDFHVVSQLPQDIMHILLEGVIPYEVALMLTSFISQKKNLSSQLLNDRISCFAYTTHEAKDKPSPIKPQVFTTGATYTITS